ncbi:glycine/D-amino acid oxidase-like deaminating enzyme [Amorphus suaedae]
MEAAISSSSPRDIAVIGCGIFGATAALRLSEAGYRVDVYERNAAPLQGASFNNQNRLHLGFHYPRDLETARQCVRGFTRFVETFPDCILDGFPNGYFIARDGSQTTPEDYLAFCRALGVPFTEIDVAAFPVEVANVALGVTCGEFVYDCSILRDLVIARLAASSVRLHVQTPVIALERLSDGSIACTTSRGETRTYAAVVNCGYADINRLTETLGFETTESQYEYTAVPIIEADFETAGVTIMDGPFMTVLPFGKSGRYLLYHVRHTVLETAVGHQVPEAWLVPETSPFAQADQQALYERMRQDCLRFVPGLQSARLVGFLKGPRMVLAKRDDTDARPSIVNALASNYLTVFSGKIDHCMWVADDVVGYIQAHFDHGV